jgi:predicted RNA-binding Zn ribbon-like protein
VEREALLNASIQPGGRPPAPGALALVQAFVNTVDREHGPDLLADPEGLAAWLRRRGLLEPGTAVGERERREAVDLREALRALLLANGGHAGNPAAHVAVERAADRAGLRLRLEDGRARLVPARPGVRGALGHVTAVAAAAMADGTWARLKACPRDVCGWAFYDTSPNRSATWCSMAVCGARAKARAYYRRRREAPGG